MIGLHCTKRNEKFLTNSTCSRCQLKVSQTGFQPWGRSRLQMLGLGIQHTWTLGLDLVIVKVIGQGHVLSIRMWRIENGDSWVGPQAQNLWVDEEFLPLSMRGMLGSWIDWLTLNPKVQHKKEGNFSGQRIGFRDINLNKAKWKGSKLVNQVQVQETWEITWKKCRYKSYMK